MRKQPVYIGTMKGYSREKFALFTGGYLVMPLDAKATIVDILRTCKMCGFQLTTRSGHPIAKAAA